MWRISIFDLEPFSEIIKNCEVIIQTSFPISLLKKETQIMNESQFDQVERTGTNFYSRRLENMKMKVWINSQISLLKSIIKSQILISTLGKGLGLYQLGYSMTKLTKDGV